MIRKVRNTIVGFIVLWKAERNACFTTRQGRRKYAREREKIWRKYELG